MTRLIKVFEHEGGYISLYYYESTGLLSEIIENISKEVDSFVVDRITSFELYDMIKEEIFRLYRENDLTQIIKSSTFSEGFSFIMRKEILLPLLTFLDRISLWEMEEAAWHDLANASI
ncbi:MAG: hypothetical protein R6V53_05770 [Candidatus Woesearchaeota archaeon]